MLNPILSAALLLAFLVVGLWVAHKKDKAPKRIRPCGDPACTACALLNGKWPKYQRPYSEREAMRIRQAVREGRN